MVISLTMANLPKIRVIDAVWLLFLAALAALGFAQEHTFYEWFILLALGAAQIAETNLDVSSDQISAALAIGMKSVLCYWLVAETGGIESSYYLIFLLPIVSAASLFQLGGALLATLFASAAYLSFLLYVDFQSYQMLPEGESELALRVLFFFLSAIVVNRLATEIRGKTESLAQAYDELSEAQAEVRRSERLAALGQLSGGLAHEIRNPLGVISASAELLQQNVSKENKVAREMAGFIRGEVNRSNMLVTRFLDFARPSKLQLSEANLNEAVEGGISQLTEKLKDNAGDLRIEKDLAALPKFTFDVTLIESAVLNLLLNAHEAMPSGGTLRVRVRREKDSAIIKVSDEGVGIPDEQLENIFNPFFTTKPAGVGLGLAIVSKFIDSHGGNISVVSEEGKGSTFRISLPMDRYA